MSYFDWLIILAMYVAIVATVLLTKRYMRGVADYLAARRSAGRYLLTISAGIAGVGAISVVAFLEMGYEAGFAQWWWGLTTALVLVVIKVTGWVTYRFRRTRCLTLAEFFERRYSRRFRIFGGSVAFVAGLINFGIFPSVGARFFIYFLGLPEFWHLGSLAVPTFPTVMAALLITAVYFVFAGGQVAVLITDFIQGAFANVVFLVLVIYLLQLVGWDAVGQVLTQTEPGHSKINPFDTGYVADFNFMYFFIGMIGLFYGAMSWQGTQAYYTSARTAHEGKMGGVLETWRLRTQEVFMFVVPVLVFTVMHHADWSGFAAGIDTQLADIDNEAVRNQMRGPMVLANLLPRGLLGAFAALMLGAFISTHNTYLHSWSSIFIQDVVLPFRKEPLSPAAHLRLLRGGVIGVALFIFFFSLFYKQSQAILLFFALTGALFAGWSGAVIIGGLYTRWGTTPAAWAATIAGVTLALTGFILEQAQRSWQESGTAFWGLVDFMGTDQAGLWAAWVETHLPNGQQMWGWAMWVCSVIYVVVSLIGQAVHRRDFNLDRLLHRGAYEVDGETELGTVDTGRGWRMLGITSEFGLRDKILYILTWVWNSAWVVVFIIGTIYFLTRRIENGDWSAYDSVWLSFWKTKIWIEIGVGLVVIVWFTWGGVRDVRRMLRDLGRQQIDDKDDGVVAHQGNNTD